MLKPRFLTLLAITLAAATSRLVPHAPNFTPIAAMVLFGGFALAQALFPAVREPVATAPART